MRRLWPASALLSIPLSAQPVIDASLADPFWRVTAQPLRPAAPGVPEAMGGEVRIAPCGGHLCFAARLPEPGGKVLARSAGRNPDWETDDPDLPPVEDRVEFRVPAPSGSLSLTVNPWGAYRIEGASVAKVAALVDPNGWTVEAALAAPPGSTVRCEVTRIRSRRPLAPELRWVSSVDVALNSVQPASTIDFRPPAIGNADPPLEVGRVRQLPHMPGYLDPSAPRWDDPAWRDISAFTLPRNEPEPRRARYPASVKWVHDGATLALLIHAAESEPLVANNGGRDAPIDSDDHVALRLATDGAAFLDIKVNPVGAVRDWRGGGLRTLRSPRLDWDSNAEVRTRIDGDGWTVRMNIPLRRCAEALSETGLPSEWRVLLSRHRAPRPGEAAEMSALPPIGSETFFGPLRYRRLRLGEGPPSPMKEPTPPASELASMDSRVWTALDRRRLEVRNMVRAHQLKRAERAILDERRAWDAIQSRADWERFRDSRMDALRQAVGRFPAERPPLDVRVSATRAGRGYRLENLAYQSRAGFYVAANLYLPDPAPAAVPAIVIMHSFHYPKTQGELDDMGQLWARAGSAVLIPERLGFGERIETSPWYRHAYASRFTFRKQLALIGESFIGWMAWDLIRAVDLLEKRPGIDAGRIVLIGAVAGGNEPAAVAAALDSRIAASIPFNYDHGHVRLDADFRGELTRQINMSLVTNAVAPRRYIRASEFGWEGAETPDYPNLWVDAWQRSRKVWGFYNALDGLAAAQAYGLIRLSMERVSHCFSVGPQHRVELYPLLKRWFQIPEPAPEDLAILPDSRLSVNPYRDEARRQEALRRRPPAERESIPPSIAARLERKQLHQVAGDLALRSLRAARARRESMKAQQRSDDLRRELGRRLGDIQPSATARAQTHWTRTIAGGVADGVVLEVEEGISVPLLLIRPTSGGSSPVVVAVTHGGKDRMLAGRSGQIAALVRKGIAVCLPDLRGAGETAPDPDWNNQGARMAELELALDNTLLGARLKDLRAVIAYLRGRPGIDRRRIALWGEGFAPPNPKDLWADELEFEAGPRIQYRSDPMGATLALLAALYEADIAAVAVRGGLSAYRTLLDHAVIYTPADAVVHGILDAGDIPDIVSALSPKPVLADAFVNARNELLAPEQLQREFGTRAGLAIGAQDPADWLAAQLR